MPDEAICLDLSGGPQEILDRRLKILYSKLGFYLTSFDRECRERDRSPASGRPSNKNNNRPLNFCYVQAPLSHYAPIVRFLLRFTSRG